MLCLRVSVIYSVRFGYAAKYYIIQLCILDKINDLISLNTAVTSLGNREF